MRRRSRLLRVAKWGGVVVCVLSVAGYVWSGWFGWHWGGPGGYRSSLTISSALNLFLLIDLPP